MFQVDCHAMSDLGTGHHVSRDRYFITDLPSSESMGSDSQSEPPSPEPVISGSESATGSVRPTWSRAFAVSHGVHGLPAADRASEIVSQTAREFLVQRLGQRVQWRPESCSCALNSVPLVCAEALSDDVARHPWESGLGSTLTLAHVMWPRLHLIHVGDGRCYLRRNGQTKCLTADQVFDGTFAQPGVPADPSQQPVRRRTLWSFIADAGATPQPQVFEMDLEIGDTLILCSSGLGKGINDARISDLLTADPPARDACRRLLKAAHDGGADDDMTVIVVRFRTVGEGLGSNEASRRSA